MYDEFPINVFPDVQRNAFNKYTKKNVTEDYIYENLELRGWNCYKPFVDTGIDLIATKIDSNGRRIYRFIQIKTRELSADNSFGFTLRPKDFRIDPRHYFLLYCDSVNDILLLSMYDYLKIFYDNKEMGINHFANPSFRKDNNKLNSLKFSNESGWTWSYRTSDGMKTVDFNKFLNLEGLLQMNDTYIEDHFEELKTKISIMKFNMFYCINKTRNNSIIFDNEECEEKIIDCMNKMKQYSNEDYIKKIKQIDYNYREKYPDLYYSHKRYIYGCFEDESGGNEDE